MNTLLLVMFVIVVVEIAALWALRCRHHDAQGSWLIWTRDAQGRRCQVCGRCWRRVPVKV